MLELKDPDNVRLRYEPLLQIHVFRDTFYQAVFDLN